MTNKNRMVVAIIGPSGCGKDTLVNNLLVRHPEWGKVRSKTTRGCRGEDDKNNHVFTTVEEFESDRNNNDIVASTHYDKNYYWATYSQLNEGKEVIFYIVDIEGLRTLNENYRDKTLLSIGLYVSPDVSAERMRSRGDSDENIGRRLAMTEVFENVKEADYVINAEVGESELVNEAEKLISSILNG